MRVVVILVAVVTLIVVAVFAGMHRLESSLVNGQTAVQGKYASTATTGTTHNNS